MQARTFGVVRYQKNHHFVTVFGRTSHGIPGIEFCGVGNRFNIFKEKVLYIIKERGLAVPLRKYSITVESSPRIQEVLTSKRGSLCDLELPAFILFLQLSENIRISRLEMCFSSGRVGIDGQILSRKLCPHFLAAVSLKAGGRACHLGLDTKAPYGNRLSLRHIHPRLFEGGQEH